MANWKLGGVWLAETRGEGTRAGRQRIETALTTVIRGVELGIWSTIARRRIILVLMVSRILLGTLRIAIVWDVKSLVRRCIVVLLGMKAS